jgi:hypothetical protein
VARLDSCAVRKYFGIAARFALCAEWDVELIPEMEGAFVSAAFQFDDQRLILVEIPVPIRGRNGAFDT